MLHLVYIFAFTVIAFFAIVNLIRSLVTLSIDSQRHYAPSVDSLGRRSNSPSSRPAPHPELLDRNGKPIDEPLLVMKSVSVEDAREQLDAIYKASPSNTAETGEDG